MGSKNNSHTATRPIVTALRGCMRAVRVSKASRTASRQHPWLMEVGRTGSKKVPVRPHGPWLTATDRTGREKLPVRAYVPESLDQRIVVGRFRRPVIKEQSQGCGTGPLGSDRSAV